MRIAALEGALIDLVELPKSKDAGAGAGAVCAAACCEADEKVEMLNASKMAALRRENFWRLKRQPSEKEAAQISAGRATRIGEEHRNWYYE